MRELHVVAVSEDGRHVVLATDQGATSGGFRVALDDRLAKAVRGDLPRPGSSESTPVTPKDIQARLRAGESVEQIAASAGVPVAKIERYAGPVLSERERVLSQTRAGFVSRSRLGTSAVPLGEAVDRHLAETSGIRPESVVWSVRREHVGSWLVELSYVSRARQRQVGWRYDVARRDVTPIDSTSAALAHVEPGRAARTADPTTAPPSSAGAQPSAEAARSRPATTRAAKKAPARRAPASRPVAAERPSPTTAVRATGRAAPAPAKAKARSAVRTAAPARPVRLPAPTADAEEVRRSRATADAARRAKAKGARDSAAKDAREAAAEASRRAAAEAARKATADAARRSKADAARKAKADAARKAKADAARKAKADAARKAKADAARKAKADAARKAKADAARAARAAPPVPSGPPVLRVVGGGEQESRRRGQPQPAPAAARTAPARAAGQRASVPGWADVLLSTSPVRRAAAPDPDDG